MFKTLASAREPRRSDIVSVRDADPSDSSPIRELALDSGIDAWSEADYRDEISRPDSFVLTATRYGSMVGFLVARVVPGMTEHPDAELYNIGVNSGHIRQGIGSALVGNLLDRLAERSVRNLWLEVRESNAKAISFYKRHGFVAEVTRPGFYSNPTEDAVIMRLQISPRSGISQT
jgi:ribosomal-protein-alanine acetyltransferase